MASLARDLEAIETDEPGTAEQHRALAAIANELRTRAGVEPFPDEENPPNSNSTDAPGPTAWLEDIASRLDELGVPRVVAGAAAALRYRTEPRFTATRISLR